jgi:hypothetical protein
MKTLYFSALITKHNLNSLALLLYSPLIVRSCQTNANTHLIAGIA